MAKTATRGRPRAVPAKAEPGQTGGEVPGTGAAGEDSHPGAEPPAWDPSRAPPLPQDAHHDPVLRAAWAYYMEDLSQADIALKLGVSRTSVHNYLRQARAEGVVRIAIDPAVLARSRLSERVASAFGLAAVYLVPDAVEPRAGRVVTAAAAWLLDLVGPRDTLGVAWGETVHQIASTLPRRTMADMTIVQLVGSMASSLIGTADACSSLIADRLGARCINLHAPAVLSRAELAAALSREPAIAAQLSALRRCEAALFAVGLANADSHVVRSGVASPAELADYRARGAQAVVAGRFLDADGGEMAGPLDGRIIGISPSDLRAIPKRIVVSAEPARAMALRAALRGGFATHLITDIRSAQLLLG